MSETRSAKCEAGFLDPRPSAITREEWELRFKARLIDKGGTTPDGAQAEFDGAGFDYVSDGFENDPEGSADEAVLYWEE